jgi:NAD-dependent DNA ligase
MVDALDRGVFTRDIHKRTIQAVYLRPAQLVTFYLMASYLYYHHDVSLMEDAEYDKICQRLAREWDQVEHTHKWCVERAALTAGTGFQMRREDYPTITINAAIQLATKRGLL